MTDPAPNVPPVDGDSERDIGSAERRADGLDTAQLGTAQLDTGELAVVAQQLGRAPRGVLAIAYRTPDGQPAVVKTAPRLPDGSPFPTLYYLTDPRLTLEASRQEAAGLMRGMTERLTHDPELATAYRAAHRQYLAERDDIESLGTDFSGGGMPDRVKCLHVLMAHALAKGPGVNPFGDESVALAADTGLRGSAIPEDWPKYEEVQQNPVGEDNHE